MPKFFGRTAQKIAAVFGVLAVTASTLGATLPSTTSLGTLHTVSLKQLTGTPGFDDAAGPGLDVSSSNNIIRTNDTMTYNVELQTGMTAPRSARIELKLPAGEQSKTLPPYCLPATSSTSPDIADPAQGLTALSYKSLPQQTISCDLGRLNASQSYVFPLYSTVRPEVPNGIKLGDVSATVIADGASKTTNGVSHIVSAASRFDVQFGFGAGRNSGKIWGPRGVTCAEDTEFGCYDSDLDMMISAPAGGKGISPVSGSFTVEMDAHPDVIFGAGTTTSPGWKKAATLTAAEKVGKTAAQQLQAGFDKAWAKYKPNVSFNRFSTHGPKVGLKSGNATAENAVRESGSISNRWEGTTLIATISGADTSAWTYPSTTAEKETLPTDRAFVGVYGVKYRVPGTTIDELSNESRNNLPASGTRTLPTRLQLSEMNGKALDSSAVQTYRPSDDNNYKTFNVVLRPEGSWDSGFIGVPGQTGNTTAKNFRPTWAGWEGLPGSSQWKQGDGMLMDGQVGLISNHGFLTKGPFKAAGRLACNTWDSRLDLTAGDYGPSTLTMKYPSDGRAAWLAQVTYGTTDNTKAIVQFGRGATGNGEASHCSDADSTVGWHTDPAKVPGNDPAMAKEGIYTGINKARILVKSNFSSRTFFDVPVALSYQGGAKPGDALSTWYSVSNTLELNSITDGFKEAFAADDQYGKAFSWANSSTYQSGPTSSDTFMGSYGDRLIIGDAYTSVKLDVQDGGGTWQAESAEFEAGSAAQFRITPVVSSSIDTGKKFSPTVEVCLPAGTSLVGSNFSLAPSGFSTTNLKGRYQECETGGTLVTWNLNGYEANKPIPPITFFASSYSSMEDMSVQLNAAVGLPGEAARIKDRQNTANMNLMSPMTAGFDLTVSGGNSIIDVDPLTASKQPQNAAWKFEYFNRGNSGQIGDIDMAVVLPRNGHAGSAFNGTSKLKALKTVQGTGMVISYSTSKTVAVDSKGTVINAGTWTASTKYTGGIANVTAIRVQRAGLLVSGQGVALVATTEVRNNRTGDVYKAMGSGGAGTFQGVQIDNDEDNAVSVKGGSIGDRVWADVNGNGLQDGAENGIPGTPVTLTGTTVGGDILPKKSTVTDKNGLYTFDNLPAGSYTVTFDKTWMTANHWDLTRARLGFGVNDSAANVTSGGYSLTLTAHNDIDNADAGLLGNATVAISRTSGRDTDWIYRGQYPRQILTIKNTGDFAVTGINITDAATGPVTNSTAVIVGTATGALSSNADALSHTWTGTLKPGQSVTVHFNHKVDANAEANAVIRNALKGSGSWIGGKARVLCTTGDFRTADDCFAESKVAVPQLAYGTTHLDSGSTLKNAKDELVLNEAVDGKFGPGEKLSVIQTVKNTGNVPVTMHEAIMRVQDSEDRKIALAKGSAQLLQPGATATFSVADITTSTQGQVDADSLFTSMRLHSTSPNAYQVTGINDLVGSQQAPTNRAPGLFMSAIAHDESGNGVVEPEEKGHWLYTLVNTGNLTLSQLAVQDAIGGKLTPEDGFDGKLSPGEKVVMERAGKVPAFNTEGLFSNPGTGTAKTPLRNDAFGLSSKATTWLSKKSSSGIDLIKKVVDASGDGILSQGESYHYTFRAINNSDETYSHVDLVDPTLADSLIIGPDAWNGIPAEEKVLRPGQSVSWKSQEMIATQDHAQAGFAENKASVAVLDSKGDAMVSNTSAARVSAVGTPVMIAAGAGAGMAPVEQSFQAPTAIWWATGGLAVAVAAAGLLWLRRKA